MNSNQGKNLTPKQRELVKRLDKIRKNKQAAPTQNKKRNQKRKQPETTSSRQTQTTRTEQFSRPTVKAAPKNKERTTYKSSYVRPAPRNQPKEQKKKESANYVNRLSNGKKLSQAIILSEILDKPIALRRRR